MRELIDDIPQVAVQEAEYRRLLGYPPGRELEGRPRELADASRAWYEQHGKPWIYGRLIEPVRVADGGFWLGDRNFASKHVHDMFGAGKVHAAMAVAVSAGPECEAHARQCWQDGKPDEYFFMEMFGSAVVENLIAAAGGRICGWAEQNGMTVLPHYSPGYSGWEVAEQIKLWKMIRPEDGHGLPGELEVLSTGMLRPKKSLLAVFGITYELETARGMARLVPCENCSLPACPYRRAPYKSFLPQIEDIRRLQTVVRNFFEPTAKSMLDHNARYSINDRALRKWSDERLRLAARPDGSIEARFRYEGTTCSNMGRPLEFDYHIVLGPPAGGHIITEASCVPAPDDIGHTLMCDYMNDPRGFMSRLEGEKPLLGRPLNEVLAWSRPYNPSACFCSEESRQHKWGLVLEVIHYTLVQREKAAGTDGQPRALLE